MVKKLGGSLHSNKCAILRALTDTFEAFGNGYDMEIKSHFLVVSVCVANTVNGNVKTQTFQIQLQEGDQDMVYACAVDRMQKDLKRVGAEFKAVNPWHYKGMAVTQKLLLEKKNASVAD